MQRRKSGEGDAGWRERAWLPRTTADPCKGETMTKAMRVLCVITLLAGAAAIANAQDNLRVNVPFQFSVNGKTLPAGTYSVSRAFDGNPGVRLLQGADQNPVAFNVA